MAKTPKTPKADKQATLPTEAAASPASAPETAAATPAPTTAPAATTEAPSPAPAGPADRLAESPRKLLSLPCTDVAIAGIDFPGEESDPLYDKERVTGPIDEALVTSIIAEYKASGDRKTGVQKPLEVKLRDGKFVVSGGQRRTRHARVASERLKLATPMHLDFWLVDYDGTSTPKEQFFAARHSNALAVVDGPVAMARNADRARRLFGATLPECAKAEGVDLSTLKQHMVLLKLAPEYLAMVSSGELAATIGSQLGKFQKPDPTVEKPGPGDTIGDFDKQREVYNRLSAAGNLSAQSVRREKETPTGAAVTAIVPATGEGAEATAEPGEGGGFDHSAQTPEELARNAAAGSNPGAAEPAKAGYTLAEIRRVRDWLKAQEKPTPSQTAALMVLRICTGDAKPTIMQGMKEAFENGLAQRNAPK